MSFEKDGGKREGEGGNGKFVDGQKEKILNRLKTHLMVERRLRLVTSSKSHIQMAENQGSRHCKIAQSPHTFS